MSAAILLESGNYTFRAVLEDSMLDTIEQNHNSWQPIRRAALVVMCRDYEALAAPLVRNDEEKAETLIYLIEQLDEFLAWRKREQELLEAAAARLMLVLTQEAERFTVGETKLENESKEVDQVEALCLDLSGEELEQLRAVAEQEGADLPHTAARLLGAALRHHADVVAGGAA